MKRALFFLVSSLVWLAAGIFSAAWADSPVRIQGVAILAHALKAAEPELVRMGITIKIGENCGNSQALTALAHGDIDIALLGRPLTAEDRANHPEKPFDEMKVGSQTIAILVSRTIWESGVHALKKEQIAQLYEGRAETWQDFGGEKRSTRFFEPAHGQGIWEMFANWLYGDAQRAPAVSWEVVSTGAETQSAVQFYNGAASVAAVRWADRREVFPLAIIDDAGEAVEPTAANVESGKYPLSRSVYVVVGDRPSGNRRKVIDFLRSEKGREVIGGNDLLPVAPLPPPGG